MGRRCEVLEALIYFVPFLVVYVFYESFRALVPAFIVHRIDAYTPYWFEVRLFGVPLFLLLYSFRNVVLDVVSAVVYALHPVYLVVYAAYLYLKRTREEYVEFVSIFTVASLIGLTGYILWPAAPPWMSSVVGVSRIPNILVLVKDAITHGIGVDPNPYAAIPSMHVGLAAVFAYSLRKRPKGRILGIIFTLLMAFSVIYTGNHYLLDIVLGLAIAGIGILVGGRLRRGFGEMLGRVARRLSVCHAEST